MNDRTSTEHVRGWLALLLVLSVPAAVYWKTLLPSISPWGDVTKWQLIGRVWGIPHPTGYPLYLLLTHAFGLLPIGTLAARINAFSTAATLGMLALFVMLLRRLGCSRSVAAPAALVLAFTHTLWSQSVSAEVYTLNALLVVAVVLLFLRWRATGTDRALLVACGVYALSFGNHMTMVLCLPGIVYLVVSTKPHVFISPRLVVSVVAIVLLCAGQYTYLFVRTAENGPHLEYRIHTLSDFIDYVTGERYRGSMFSLELFDVLRLRLPLFAGIFWRELSATLLLVPVGMVCVRDRITRNFLVILFVTYFVFVLNYRIFDIEVYCIPIYILFVLWIAVAATSVVPWLGRHTVALPPLALGAFASALLAGNYRSNDMSRATGFDHLTRRLLDEAGTDAVVIMNGWWVDYGLFEGFLYFLLMDSPWSQRGLFLSDHLPPDAVRRYLTEGVPLRSLVMSKDIPAGLKVYTTSRLFMLDMQAAALYAVCKNPDLCEVRADSSSVNVDFTSQQLVSYAGGAPFDQRLPPSFADRGVFWENSALLAFQPTAAGQFTVRIPDVKAGCYRAEFVFATSGVSGVIEVRGPDGMAVVEGVDLYAADAGIRTVQGTIQVRQAGAQDITFEVVSRNGRSRGYAMGVDYLNLIPMQ